MAVVVLKDNFDHRKLREEPLPPRTTAGRANRTQPEEERVNQGTEDEMKQESCLRNMSEWREVDFALNCTYIVHDQPFEPGFTRPRAMSSIPVNLTFHYGSDNELGFIQ
ncbi:hypothetical protein PDJAM_G00050190 [Pangasius djambal]|uniref:Uncharacterized protein n=1 Tax=Pangasius djambal TaxID=1691987 RepID=A0ACC5YW99_9TELE|nr:hypothetical protein [Pangasius djambal]